MNTPTYEKKVLYLLILSVVISCGFLLWVERVQNSYTLDKDWWSVSFVDPTGTDNYSFILENYTQEHTTFSYMIHDRRFPDTVQFPEETISLPRGEQKIIPVPIFVSHAELIIYPINDPEDEKMLWK